MTDSAELHGEWDDAFAAIPELMRTHLDALAEPRGGASVCVYHRGRKVVDAWCGEARDGEPWEHDTMAMAWSTGKGITSTILHRLASRGLVEYDAPVAQYWPEFASNGKQDITVRQVLCHESGLFDAESIIHEDAYRLLDWQYMTDALAAMTPAFEPGTANAYCALTFGFLVGEIMRRVTGQPVDELVRTEVTEPLGLDGCFIGTPPSEYIRVAQLIPGEDVSRLSAAGEGMGDLAALFGLDLDPSVQRAALGGDIPPLERFFTDPVSMSQPIPAANLVCTARSVARVYAALANGGALDGSVLLDRDTLEQASTVQNDRPDRVLVFPMMWRLGYHGVLTTAGVPPRGFGHNGLGGSGGWADPDRNLAVAFVPSRLGSVVASDSRFMEIGGAAITAADSLS